MMTFVDFLIRFYAFFSVLPVMAFLLVWVAVRLIARDKKRAVRASVDVTMLMLLGSVGMMYNYIFQSTFGFWWILLYFLIFAGLLGGMQNRLKGRIDVKRLVKVIWRLSFVLFSIIYVVFFIIGLGKTFRIT